MYGGGEVSEMSKEDRINRLMEHIERRINDLPKFTAVSYPPEDVIRIPIIRGILMDILKELKAIEEGE